MNYSRGEIVWVKFPFSNISASKFRPALIISNNTINKTGDYIMMQITTNLRDDEFSLRISPDDFVGSSLLKQSELRLHKIFILNETLINSGITNVSSDFMQKVVNKLITLIK